ncbi:polysaccharide biosynthesis tyrosine autokinase [Chloroflexota bacterium]
MEQRELNLAQLLKGLWRFKRIIAILVLVSGGTAWGFTLMQPHVYEATATVMVESGQSAVALPVGLGITSLQDIGSQIELMKSNSVLEQAISRLEPEKVTDPQYLQLETTKLRDALKIQQLRGTSLIAVTVVSSDSIVAQNQANAVAEVYVAEAKSAGLTAIETALNNSTKQLKELRAGNLDLSINPSLPRLTAQIDTALVALEATSVHLLQIEKGSAVILQEEPLTEEPLTLVQNVGSVLTESQLEMISQRVGAVISEANNLSALARQLNFVPIENAVVESQARALATKLESLFTQIAMWRQAETDPQVYAELLNAEELVGVASATATATLTQIESLSVSLNELGEEEEDTRQLQNLRYNLRYRIVQHTALVTSSLEAASEQLQQIEPRARAVTVSRWQIEVLRERVASAITTLQLLSAQLQPPVPEQAVIVTQAELTDMEIRAREAATITAFLLSQVEEIQLDRITHQVYSELLSVQESVQLANDVATGIPAGIAGLAEGGGGSLSYTALENLRQELQLRMLTGESSGIRVVDIAEVSATTDALGRYKNVILGVFAGLLLGILGALVFQYYDRRVRDTSQVISYVGLPLLGSFAWVARGNGNPSFPSVLNSNASQYMEAFRMLRTNLGLDFYRGQALLVSSPEEKEGKTTVAANLARVVALQGRKVLLIDGNLRKPDVAMAFGLEEAKGLSEFVASANEPWDYVTRADGVDILPSGAASEQSTEMLSSPKIQALLEKAKQTYDVVIVDSAPVIGCADTKILAMDVDEALLVLQSDTSRLDLARESRKTLETMEVRVVGFVLNKI